MIFGVMVLDDAFYNPLSFAYSAAVAGTSIFNGSCSDGKK